MSESGEQKWVARVEDGQVVHHQVRLVYRGPRSWAPPLVFGLISVAVGLLLGTITRAGGLCGSVFSRLPDCNSTLGNPTIATFAFLVAGAVLLIVWLVLLRSPLEYPVLDDDGRPVVARKPNTVDAEDVGPEHGV